MATEVGTAYVTLLPSMRGFSAAAQSEIGRSGIESTIANVATRGAGTAGTRAGGLFSRAFNRETLRNSTGGGLYVAGLLRNLRTYGYAVTGVVGLTVGLGLKTASAMEQARIAFSTILGSAKKAHTLFASLVQFAKVTPFNLPGIVSASQQVLAYGFAAKRVLPILHSLGDAAAGLSLGTDGLQRVVQALGQIKAKGRLQSQELLQLTENGIPALTILANKFGVTQSALLNLVQKGLVPANKAIPALLSGLETGTKGVAGTTASFGGLMKRQAKTLGGIFSNLKDTVSIGLARAVKPLIPVLKRDMPKAMTALIGAFRVGRRDLAEFLHGLGAAGDKSKGTVTTFESVGTAIRDAFKGAKSAVSFISRHGKVFKPLIAGMIGATVAAKVLLPVFVALDAAMDANPISLVVLAIGALAGAFIYAWHKSKTFRDVVTTVFHVLERTAGEWVTLTIQGFKYVLDAMLNFVGGMIHLAASAFGWVPGVGSKLKGAAKAFDGFRSDVDNTLSRIASDASGWGTTAGNNFNSAFTNAAGFGHGKYSPFRDPGHPGFLGPAAKAGKKAGNDAGTAVTTGVNDGLNKGAGKVAQSVSSLVSKILGPLKALRDQARQLAQSVTQAILGDTGFGAILSATDAFGQTGFGTSVKAILAGFLAQRRDVVKFRRELRQLEKRGLSAAAAGEIAGEGVAQGGQVAEALLGANRRQLRRISTLRADTHKAAHDIGVNIAGARFGKEIAVEVRRTTRAIERAQKDTSLSNKTVRALGREFKHAQESVKPYVRVTDVDKAEGKRVAALV